MKQTSKRRSTTVMIMLSYRSLISAYNMTPISRKRSIANIGSHKMTLRDSSLNMSLDSRKLRFYASSSQTSRTSKRETVTTVKTNEYSFTTYNSSYDLPLSTYPSGLVNLLNTFDAEFKRAFSPSTAYYSTSSRVASDLPPSFPRKKRNPIEIDLTREERELFSLLRQVTNECGMKSTLRVAGGWVRDKILASKEFSYTRSTVDFGDAIPANQNGVAKGESDGDQMGGEGEMKRITSKFKGEKPPTSTSNEGLSVTVPVDIDIALDDKLGREFADELNQWLSSRGRETHSVGVVLKNPEKSKHLETATMRINNYWIDFVNLRAEEYTSDSRIPDLMRIGTAEEDAFRRDLTINSLFYNINEGIVEDMTGRGLEDLKKRIVATPLPPLTTLLDDPLRVLRSVRFAARLRFGMDEALTEAAADERVKQALEQKVSRERVGSEVDLMLKSRDPVGAMRLLINLGLIETVFPLPKGNSKKSTSKVNGVAQVIGDNTSFDGVFDQGLSLLTTTHDHLCDCKANPPLWCEARRALEAGAVNGVGYEDTRVLMEDEDARRLLWYAAFLKPLRDRTVDSDEDKELEDRKKSRKAKRSAIVTLLVDELKRPARDADAVDKIMKAADGFTRLVSMGSDVSGLSVLLSELHIIHRGEKVVCTMNGKMIDPNTENDAIWKHSMEFREDCATVLKRIGPLWRAAFILSLAEQLVEAGESEIEYTIEGDVIDEAKEEVISGVLQKYDVFAASIMNLGLIGIWNQQPLLNGEEIKESILPRIPKGPAFRDVMDAQTAWMTSHPGGSRERLVEHLKNLFEKFV